MSLTTIAGGDAWRIVASGVLVALLFRSLPLAGSALLSPRVQLRGKCSAAAILSVVTVCVALLHPSARGALVDCALAWTYLLLAALAVHFATRWLDAQACTSAGLLIGAAVLFLLLPSLMLRNSVSLLLLATGFEVAFSAHSYWRESAYRARNKPSCADCAEFLLVNPVLVYPTRYESVHAPAWSGRAALRIALGAAGTWVSSLLSMAAPLVGSLLAEHAGASPWSALMVTCLMLVTNLFAQYCGHSSLAHLQIGGMRLLGYRIPERYRMPFLARSPDEFWRRWNTYVGAWLLRYAYLPLAQRYQRALPVRLWLLGKGAALVATFAVCGLAHEAAGFALRWTIPLGIVIAFTGYGVLLIVWLGLKQLSAAVRVLIGASGLRIPSFFGALFSGAITATMILLFSAVALPALAGAGLHPLLTRWLSP